MYSYEGLYKLLKKNNMKKSDLTIKVGISSRTIAKLSKGEKIANNVIQKICVFYKKVKILSKYLYKSKENED